MTWPNLRFPITYNVSEDASDEIRRAQRDQLTRDLESALRDIFNSEEFKTSFPKAPSPPPFVPKDPLCGKARFRLRDQPLGVHIPVESQLIGRPQAIDVYLMDGAATWLRVMPQDDPERIWLNEDLRDLALKLSTVPLIPSVGDIRHVRADDGFGYYRDINAEKTSAVSFLFQSGEIWIIRVLPNTVAFPFDEIALSAALEACVSFLGDALKVPPPYRWIVGIEGIKGRPMYIPSRSNRSSSPCLTDTIERQGAYQASNVASEALRPFFEQVFDQCGLRRANVIG